MSPSESDLSTLPPEKEPEGVESWDRVWSADALVIAGTGGWASGVLGARTHFLLGILGAAAFGALAIWYTPHAETVVEQWESKHREDTQ